MALMFPCIASGLGPGPLVACCMASSQTGEKEGALDSGHVANNFCVNKPPCAIGYQLLEKRIQVILVIQGSEVINPHNMDPRTSLLPQSLLVAGRSWSSGQGQRPFKHRELAGLGVPGNAPSWSRHRSFDL